MATPLPRRILIETQKLLTEPVPGIEVRVHEENARYFDVVLAGPISSPYEGGKFKLELYLPPDYPMSPPKVRFLTRVYHPNIDKLGRICLSILKTDAKDASWSPALNIRTCLVSIQALLSAPNVDDPLDPAVCDHWIKNEAEAVATAKEYTKKYAK